MEKLYTEEDMKRCWRESAELTWRTTGEGFNGEYCLGYGTHDGSVSFAEVMKNLGREDNCPYGEKDDWGIEDLVEEEEGPIDVDDLVEVD